MALGITNKNSHLEAEAIPQTHFESKKLLESWDDRGARQVIFVGLYSPSTIDTLWQSNVAIELPSFMDDFPLPGLITAGFCQIIPLLSNYYSDSYQIWYYGP